MTNKFLKRPEILAPCGSYDILKAAINAGCDACYIGGSKFGARAYAENIGSDSIIKSIDYAHLHDVRLYLTVNTLFKDNEIDELYDFLKPYYEAGLDAVIVQDLGVFYNVRRLFPDLSVHLSTQMNITSKYAAEAMKELGASRVVTAREMSISEIKDIKDNVDIELEVFVHGAMCYSYSGRCLMSSLAGGRSGNRGRCAQPCRKCYDKDYVLSMKDMCSLMNVPDLIDIGVDSLKIEGRMKNEYYVASAVEAYRTISEDYISDCFSEKKALYYKDRLANIFNRGGFSDGYFYQAKGADMISIEKPNNMGVKIGTVNKINSGKVDIKLTKDLYKQDIVELMLKDNSIIELTSPIEAKNGQLISLNAPKSKLIIGNQDVYRTRCNKLIDDIKSNIIDNNKRNALDIVFEARLNNRLCLKGKAFIDNKAVEATVYSDYIVEESSNKPADREDILKKLSQLNDTNWMLNNAIFDIAENAFVPAGEIKKLRRNLIEELEIKLVNSYRRSCKIDYKRASYDKYTLTSEMFTGLKVSVLNLNQLKAISKYKNIAGIYISKVLYQEAKEIGLINKFKENDTKLYITLPYIVRSSFDLDKYLNDIECDGLYVRNIDGMFAVKKALKEHIIDKKDIVCANSLYAYNKAAKHFIDESFKEVNISNIIYEASYELNLEELISLDNDCLELLVYGHLNVMLSAQCVQNTKFGCNKNNSIIKITDDKNNTFYAYSNCDECLGIIYNGVPYSFIQRLGEAQNNGLKVFSHKIDFTIEDEATIDIVLKVYHNCDKINKITTTGHMFRGVE